MYECFASICVCTHYMCTLEDQKKLLEPLELESQMVVSHCVDARDQTLVLCKSIRSSNSVSVFLEQQK